MENQVQPETITQPSKPNSGLSWKGIAEVFYNPAGLFTKIKENPKILVPYLVFGLVILAVHWSIRNLVVNEILQMPEVQARMETMGEITDKMKNTMAIGQAVQWTAIYLICPLLAAGLAFFWGSFIFGGGAKYKQLLSVMLYGELIFAAGHLLLLPLILAKQNLYVTLSLGALAPEKSFSNTLFAVLSKFDLFIIWEVIVIGVGLSVIYGFPRNKGYLISVLSMGMLTILAIVTAIISSFFR